MGKLNQLYLEYQKSAQNANKNEQATKHLKDKFVQYLNSSPPPVDLYEQDRNGYSVLAYAAFYDDTETFTSVLTKMDKFKESDVKHYFLPLLISANKGNDNHMRLLLKHGANINAVNEDGASLLHMAASNGDIIPTRKLLYYGANITAFVKLFPEQVATDGRMSIFDLAFTSKNSDRKQKVAVINYLFLWAWSKNIVVDLTGITIDPAITSNLIVLNAIINRSLVAQYTPSFEKSMTKFEELLDLPQQDLSDDDIYQAIKRRIEEGDNHPILKEYAAKVRARLLSKTPVPVKDFLAQTLFAPIAVIAPNTDAFKKAKEGLPAELRNQVEELTDKLIIRPGEIDDAQHASASTNNEAPAEDKSRNDIYKYL